jgi:ATP phosphoribosyltransferase
MKQQLTIALSKGRILKETLPLLAAADIVPAEDIFSSRKLIFDTNHEHIKFVVIRATDVPTYVEYGGADMGIAGKDVLLEHGAKGLYEPLDLKIARCRLMVAGMKGAPAVEGRMKVASKFVNITRDYLLSRVYRLISSNCTARWSWHRLWAWLIVSLILLILAIRCEQMAWNRWNRSTMISVPVWLLGRHR